MTLYHKTFEARLGTSTVGRLNQIAADLAAKAGIDINLVEVGASAWPCDDGTIGCEIHLRASRPMTDEEIAEIG